jgi:RND superfamily putative drug exporter
MGAVSQVFEEDGRDYQYVKVTVVTKEEPMSDLSIKTVSQLYSAESGFAGSHSYVNGSYITGAAVMTYEVSEIVTEDFDYIKAAGILLLILLLFLVMRSYVTPIRAVLTILMSIMWTLGLTFILFDQLMGVPVVWIVPIVLFVICLGHGMD